MSYLSRNQLAADQRSAPLWPLDPDGFEQWKNSASAPQRRWVEQAGFAAAAGEVCAVPDADGAVAGYLFGVQDTDDITQLAAVAGRLPPGVYRLDCDWPAARRRLASLGWGLGNYRFERYKAAPQERPVLLLDDDIDAEVRRLHAAQCLVRDLVNTPTEHMGPQQLADAAEALAAEFDAEYRTTDGDDLLTQNFPAIHAVGRASDRAPRLVELRWGQEGAPLVALVGKGVCFDTGGLDLKPAAGMALMKKDMGGAAHTLALARMVMEAGLPVRLLLLIPAVENAVAGNAYRPGDVIATRKGLSVEIGNTDAEGRVILSDALAFACEHEPELVIDFATLTGAARVALGADLPPLFSNRDDVAHAIQQAGEEVEDPLWTMPLYRPYRKLIESPIADINNSGKGSFAGCITAALFLEHFVDEDVPWVHIDTFAWNQSDRPARPQGGEALGLRAVFRFLQSRYG